MRFNDRSNCKLLVINIRYDCFSEQLDTEYPNSTVEIALATTEAPTLEIESSGLRGHFVGQAVFTVRSPNGTNHPAFTLDVVIADNRFNLSGAPPYILSLTVVYLPITF